MQPINTKGLAGQVGRTLKEGSADLPKLEAKDPGATAHIGNVLEKTVDPNVIGADRHKARLAVFDELVMSADFSKLAETAQWNVVRSNLLAAVRSSEREKETLVVTFRPDDFGVAQIDAKSVASAFKGLGGLAKTLGAELSNDGWARAALNWGVRIPRVDDVSVMSKAQLGTQYPAGGRSYLGMFRDLQDEASASPDVAGKADFREMLDRARVGVEAGEHAAVYALTHDAFNPGAANLAMAADVLPDVLKRAPSTILLDNVARGSIHLLGRDLSLALAAYEADPKAFNWEQFPDAKKYAQAEQGYWLKSDRARKGGTTQGRGVAAFDALTKEQQVQNLRSTISALQGLVRADELVQSMLGRKEAPSKEVIALLQEHLDMASQQALGTERYDLANFKFGEAVADQMAPQIGWILQKFGGRIDNEILANVSSALLDMALQSGADLPTKGAGAASQVAVENMGVLLKAANPDQNKTGAEWQKEAERVLGASGFGSAAAFLGALVDTAKLPNDVKAQVGAKWKDNWGIADIMKIPEGGDTKRDVKNFAVLMAALNATWLTQQAGRAHQDELKGQTDVRVQNKERDVFAPYLGLLQANTAEGVLGQLFRILQDQMEGMKKAAVLPKE